MKKDKIKIKKDYHPNGKIWHELRYVNGKENGIQKEFDENGNISCEHYCVNDLWKGIFISFYFYPVGLIDNIDVWKKDEIHEADITFKYQE